MSKACAPTNSDFALDDYFITPSYLWYIRRLKCSFHSAWNCVTNPLASTSFVTHLLTQNGTPERYLGKSKPQEFHKVRRRSWDLFLLKKDLEWKENKSKIISTSVLSLQWRYYSIAKHLIWTEEFGVHLPTLSSPSGEIFPLSLNLHSFFSRSLSEKQLRIY